MKHLLAIATLAAALACLAACESTTLSPPPAPPEHVATKPVPRTEVWWKQRHGLLSSRASTGLPQVLFLGDSITQGWEDAGKDVWAKAYGGRSAINLGIGGDRTQHVLWRLEHGNLPQGLSPKLAVVMIGTNNSGSDTSARIADGVVAIVRELWIELPKTEILVLAIFPRGATPGDAARKVNEGANALLQELPARFKDGRVRVLDIGTRFLQPDGTLPRAIMPDLLHLSTEGYRIWARAIEPEVAKTLGDPAREI